MALTENEVTICNQALAKIGSFTLDFSDTTGTGNSGMAGNVFNKCNIQYAQTRNALLRSADWNFAAERLTLVNSWATDTAYTTDQYVWSSSVLYKCNTAHLSDVFETDYIYDDDVLVMDGDEPIRDESIGLRHWDMILTRCQFEFSYKYSVPADFARLKPNYFKDNWIEARVEGAYILTDETGLEIKYTKKVTDPDDFDPLFTEVLICDLALKLLVSLAGSGYVMLAGKKDIQQERIIAIRRARNVCASENKPLNLSQWVNARDGTGKV
jgi:hypothetical protein